MHIYFNGIQWILFLDWIATPCQMIYKKKTKTKRKKKQIDMHLLNVCVCVCVSLNTPLQDYSLVSRISVTLFNSCLQTMHNILYHALSWYRINGESIETTPTTKFDIVSRWSRERPPDTTLSPIYTQKPLVFLLTQFVWCAIHICHVHRV